MGEVHVDEIQGNGRLELGKIDVEESARLVAQGAGVSLASLIARHARGDWGDIGESAREMNEYATEHGWRVASSYNIGDYTIRVVTSMARDRTGVTLAR